MHFSGIVTPRTGSAVALLLAPVIGLTAAFPSVAATLIGQCEMVSAAADLNRSLGLKFDPALNLEPSSTTQTPAYVFGRSISGQTEDLIEAKGDAEFRKLGMFIKGDSIRHDLVKDELFAQGSVKLYREGEFFEGPRLRLKLGTTQGFFEDVSFQLTSTGGRGTAERAEFIQPLETRLIKATFTTCPRDRPAWELRSDELLVDQIREVGATKSSTLYWGGVPIIPFGDAAFSISDRRKTGVLPPSYATSVKLGLDVAVPFYWNIAPEHDMTITPRIITKRGMQLGGEFRFLRPTSLGTLAYEVLPSDRVTGEDRRFGSATMTHRLGDLGTLGLNVQRASDDNYFSDLGNSLLASSQRLLPATASLTSVLHRWQLQAQVQEYQLLQDRTSPLLAPYSFAPKVTLSRQHRSTASTDRLPIDWSAAAEAVSFQHPTLSEGERYVGTAAVSMRTLTQGVTVEPRLSVHATHYSQRRDGRLDRTLDKYLQTESVFTDSIYKNNVGATPSYTRVLPTFSTSMSAVLERPAQLGGLSVVQTLEPRISYIYTPYKNQSAYPVFDTGSPSLNFAQMFSDTAFNGHDRIADLNQITAGVTTRLVEDDSGIERLRASVGQRFYFADQRVVLPGTSLRTDRNSDLLAQISAQPRKDWTVESQVQYTLATSDWKNLSLINRFNPRPASMLSLAYRYVRGASNSVDMGFQWPISNHWYAVGRYQHALKNLGGGAVNQNPGTVEALAGFEYDGGCWVARIVAQQYATSASEKNTAFFFQIELNGLARVGTNPLGVLRTIPNYQLINQITPLPSKFDNFQ